jgi:microcompartment protein CcmK/EutM
MNLGVIHGVVVADTRVQELTELRLVVVQPVDEAGSEQGRALVALDPVVSAAEGALVWFVNGSDAADTLDDSFQPVDAAVVGLVSSIREAPA